MKFSWRIFFLSFVIILVAFGTGGLILIDYVYNQTLDSSIRTACDRNGFVASSFKAIKQSTMEFGSEEEYTQYITESLSKQITNESRSTTLKIGDKSIVGVYGDKAFADELSVNSRRYRILCEKDTEGIEQHYIQTVSRITLNSKDYYIQTITNISDIYTDRVGLVQFYQILLLCIALLASLVLVVMAKLLTRPVERLSEVAVQIADGDLSKRARVQGSQETKRLAESFNTMADCVEQQINELVEASRSKDDFIGSFTHELKTPLTSIIGYADMLRSYEMDSEKRRSCADFIYKEGKRLEALSFSLLELLVVKKSEFELSATDSEVLVNDVKNSTRFILDDNGLELETDCEPAKILAEPSLIKTLLYNLIDNARKASHKGQIITLSARSVDDKYIFCVTDYGIGIPKSELNKIKEPFYMVDKSRARKMGGAGLGLAICNEIALLHNSELEINSTEGKGSNICFSVPLEKEAEYE